MPYIGIGALKQNRTSWSSYWPPQILGDYSKTATTKNTYRWFNKKLTGNGYIKCSSAGLTIDDVKSCHLFLNNHITTAETNGGWMYLSAFIMWNSEDNSVLGKRDGVDVGTGGTFSAGQEIRLRRQGSRVYYEYSNNGTSWISVGSAILTGDLYAGIFFNTFETSQEVKNVTIGGDWEDAYPEVELGDYSSVAGNYETIPLYKKLLGDGWIKFNCEGLTEAQADRVVMFLHYTSTFPANNSTLSQYIFWYKTDHKAHAEMASPNHSISGGTFNANTWLRLRRFNNIIYWEYSTDNINWTVLQSYERTGVVYAGLMFLVANTAVKNVTVFGFKDYGYTTQSSGDMRFFVPRDYVATNKVVMYTHGSGEDEDAPITDALKIPTINAFIDEGWGVISCLASGNNWGNQASWDSYYDLLTWAKTVYAFTQVDIFGQSMGGLNGLQLFMTDTQFARFLGIYPVTNLANMFPTAFKAAIKTAYGFVDDADYETATEGHDPMLLSGALLGARKLELVASPDDVVVSKTNNTDLFNTTFASADITVIAVTGDHGDTSHFNPSRDVVFLKG